MSLPYVDSSVSMGRAIYCLLCQVSTSYLALPLEHVHEVMRPLPIAAVTDASDWFLGLAVIRGRATPVIDAERLLFASGGQAHARRAPGRFVALRIETRSVAIAVEAVLGSHALSDELSVPVPPLMAASAAFSALAVRDGQLLALLNTARLFRADELREQGYPLSAT
jgi:chemotaxis signal transduction protein